MDNKIKHLEFIQAIISRLAQNSFLIKGWTITVVSAIFVVVLGNNNRLFDVVYIVVGCFWILDAYFLYLERCYRDLYDKARTSTDLPDFSLNYLNSDCWCVNLWSIIRAGFSISSLMIYIPIILANYSLSH